MLCEDEEKCENTSACVYHETSRHEQFYRLILPRVQICMWGERIERKRKNTAQQVIIIIIITQAMNEINRKNECRARWGMSNEIVELLLLPACLPAYWFSPIIPWDFLRSTKPSLPYISSRKAKCKRERELWNSLSNQRECTGINYEISNQIMTRSDEFSYWNGIMCVCVWWINMCSTLTHFDSLSLSFSFSHSTHFCHTLWYDLIRFQKTFPRIVSDDDDATMMTLCWLMLRVRKFVSMILILIPNCKETKIKLCSKINCKIMEIFFIF